VRYPPGYKQETSERILRAAGRLFRRQGYAATGVDAVMASADLTAGAFYSHFRSKEDLLAEALDTVFREARNDRPKRLSQLRGREWIRAFATFYLSKKHRDTPDRGCPVAALAGEIGRLGGKSRAVMVHHLRRMLDTVGQQFDPSSPDRSRAITGPESRDHDGGVVPGRTDAGARGERWRAVGGDSESMPGGGD